MSSATDAEIRLELRGVVYRDNAEWIAHCLELDITAEGNTSREALNNAIELCSFQIQTAIEDGNIESVFRAAPPEYWRMFFSVRESRISQHPVGPLSQFEAREILAPS